MSYPTKKLWEICELYQPKTISKKEMIDNWKYVVFWANWIIWRYNNFNHKDKEILITCRWATCWNINISDKYSWINWNAMVSHIINKNELDFLYLFYCFKYIDFSKVISGSAQPQITRIWLVDIQIPLPPLPTQKLIVQKLDSAFKNIDESIKITKKNIENIEELNKSVLEDILKRFENKITTIDRIAEKVQYWYTWKTIEKWKYRYLRITDIQKNNIIWKKVPFVWIEENEAEKYLLNIWDIVFARTWATVWKSCLIDERWLWNIFASYLIRIVSKKDLIFSDFLKYFFYSQYYWEQVYEDVVWAAQPNFNWTKLKKIKIPLPPLSKQKEIVLYLDEVFEKNKVIKELYEKKLKDLEEMKQSILKEAFEGRLVE